MELYFNYGKFRTSGEEILEGIILTKEEYKSQQTVTFHFYDGKMTSMVENYYDATVY